MLNRLFVAIVVSVLIQSISTTPLSAQDQQILLVVGAEGSPEYGRQFSAWADQWESVMQNGFEEETADESSEDLKTSRSVTRIGDDAKGETTDRERLKTWITENAIGATETWIVFLGHGTDDRTTSKFNLRGPDVSATELAEWLKPVQGRKVIINCASASGSWLRKLKSENQIVVAATKSGAQHNFARFGGYLAKAISDPALDLDKDQQTSLLEAFIAASNQTQEFYETEDRLASELAAIDDNGDGLGTPADWFQGTRVAKKSKRGSPDGLAANQTILVRRGQDSLLSPEQLQQRDQLEVKLEELRLQKSEMTEEVYYQTIEPVLLELANLYREANESSTTTDTDSVEKGDSEKD